MCHPECLGDTILTSFSPFFGFSLIVLLLDLQLQQIIRILPIAGLNPTFHNTRWRSLWTTCGIYDLRLHRVKIQAPPINSFEFYSCEHTLQARHVSFSSNLLSQLTRFKSQYPSFIVKIIGVYNPLTFIFQSQYKITLRLRF